MLEHNKAGKWIKLMIVLAASIFALSIVSASSGKTYESWTYDNFPIFKDIKLKYVDIGASGWEGLFIPPNIIILSRQGYDIGSDYHRGLVSHELMHYYCWREFKDMDFKHERCFSSDYNLKKSMY